MLFFPDIDLGSENGKFLKVSAETFGNLWCFGTEINASKKNTFFGAEVKVWNPTRKIWRFLLKSFEIPRDDAWPAEVPLEIQYPDFCWTSKKPGNLEHVQLKQAEVFTAKSSVDFCREACFRCFYIKSYRVVIAMDHGELSDLDWNPRIYFTNKLSSLHCKYWVLFEWPEVLWCISLIPWYFVIKSHETVLVAVVVGILVMALV